MSRSGGKLRGGVQSLILVALACGGSQAFAADPAKRCAVPAGTAPFEFASEGNTLRGFVDLPSSPGKHSAIVIVHGSGPTNVTDGEGWYKELRSVFRGAGIATVVWDKAGNGCSDGRYPSGTPITLRATETVAAIDALKRRDDIDASRIGLWAMSQGGWVAPIAAVRSRDIAFLILVSSPGGDALSQMEYSAFHQLLARGVSEGEARSAIGTQRRASAIMRGGGSLEEFIAAVEPLQKYPLFREIGVTVGTPEGYRYTQTSPDFLLRPDTFLSELTQPTLAIFGDHDVIIDWRESVHIYRESIKRAGNRDLTIKVFKNADHGLFTVRENQSAPQLVDGYLNTIIAWLRARRFAT